MKTKNNVQKTISKMFAVIVSLVLISFTVSAQGFWEILLENATVNEIVLAMTEGQSEKSGGSDAGAVSVSAAFADLLAEEADESLELEEWMTTSAGYTGIAAFALETADESELALEEWMTGDAFLVPAAFYLEDANEEPLEMEDWMEDVELFKGESRKNVAGTSRMLVQAEDPVLKLENWMLDNSVWKN